jgi:carbamate kinase
VVVALGGNAILRRGQPFTVEIQRENVRTAAGALAPLVADHELVITHGNGPQVGLLALQASEAGAGMDTLDLLGAQSDGMIGYMIEQELGNLLPFEQPFATILTMVEVDPDDPAFDIPTKPIGIGYPEAEARRLADERGWAVAPDGDLWRRVVPSPKPLRVFEIRPIEWLLERGVVVICTGGGGIPTMYGEDGALHGANVVVDKDKASALLARQLEADLLVLATDVAGVYAGWGTPEEELLKKTTPGQLRPDDFPVGSMGPKVEAACGFVEATGRRAVIGSLDAVDRMLEGTAGTQVVPEAG